MKSACFSGYLCTWRRLRRPWGAARIAQTGARTHDHFLRVHFNEDVWCNCSGYPTVLIFCIRGAYFTRQGYRGSGLHTLTENLLHALRRRERTSQGSLPTISGFSRMRNPRWMNFRYRSGARDADLFHNLERWWRCADVVSEAGLEPATVSLEG